MTRLDPRIGLHIALGGGMVRAVDRAHALGATAIQVFAGNPSGWRRSDVPHRELPAFRARCAALGIEPIAIHAAYLVNLASPEPDVRERSIGLLAAELAAAPGFGAAIVNMHAGSHRETTAREGIDRLADGVARVLADIDDGPGAPRLVIENSAGAGSTIGVTLEELAMIAEAIAARGVPGRRVGFCLDTAHLWGAGHPIDRPEGVDTLLETFVATLGREAIALVHLNDSRAELGSRVDRHEHLGAGGIGLDGLGHLIRHPLLADVPLILETPEMDTGWDAVNVARALDLAHGRPVDLDTRPDDAGSAA